jgi:hypothetical protein
MPDNTAIQTNFLFSFPPESLRLIDRSGPPAPGDGGVARPAINTKRHAEACRSVWGEAMPVSERHVLVRGGILRLTVFGDDEVDAAGGHFQLRLRGTVLRRPCAHAKIFAGNRDQVALAQVLRTGFGLFAPARHAHPVGGLAFAVALVNRQVEVGDRLAGLRLTQLRFAAQTSPKMNCCSC